MRSKTKFNSGNPGQVTRSLIREAGDVPVINVGTMSQDELQERLNYFARRSQSLCGKIGVMEGGKLIVKELGATVSDFFKTMLKSTTDPEVIRQRNEFMARVQNGDPVAKAQFCAARLEQYNNFLMARLDWINQYAEIVTLAPDEWAAEQNSTQNEITCLYIGEDGTAKMQKIAKEDPEFRLQIRLLTTPVIRYKARDLYRGNVVDAALQTINLTFDMANKANSEFFTMLKNNAFVAAWSFSNAKKQKWPFITNSYIDQNNLPAGNDVTVTGASSSTFFDWATLDEIVDWAARWNGLSPDGDLRPTGRIRLPSSHMRKFGSGTSPSGAMPSKPAEQVLEQGWTGVRYRNIDWTFIPDSTLPANAYTCYPEFNMKPARYFKKPAFDQDVVRTGQQDHRLLEANEEERQVQTVYSASINTANYRKLARFTYKV